MTDDHRDELLRETRRTLNDVESQISEVVSALERGGGEPVEELLAEALSRLKMLDQRVRRHLEGSDTRG